MKPEKLRGIVLKALGDVAPELESEGLDPKAELRDQLDLDSMDFLNFVLGLHKALDVDIPEADYRKLASLDACVAYLAEKIKPA
jgi:acyl carrier protein